MITTAHMDEGPLDPLEALIASIAPIAEAIRAEAEAMTPDLERISARLADISGILTRARS